MPSGGRLRLLLVAAESCSVIAQRKRSLKKFFVKFFGLYILGFPSLHFPFN
jgi:hypothetical protein